jgi:glycosyltransferase A (GT-A) superfamily protein (DUF2064 family)
MQWLEQTPVVLGPSEDGGYYLVGQRSPGVEMFAGIPWSARETYASTVETLARLGVDYVELPRLADVDTLDDLERPGLKARLPEELHRAIEKILQDVKGAGPTKRSNETS